MRIFKPLALLFICLSLLGGGVATAMPCCIGKDMSQMQMDNSKSDMPCHQSSTKKSNTKNHNSCEKCQNCIATSALIPSQENNTVTFTNILHNDTIIGFISHEPSGIYSPPKQIS